LKTLPGGCFKAADRLLLKLLCHVLCLWHPHGMQGMQGMMQGMGHAMGHGDAVY
jgi:hypothetical protein